MSSPICVSRSVRLEGVHFAFRISVSRVICPHTPARFTRIPQRIKPSACDSNRTGSNFCTPHPASASPAHASCRRRPFPTSCSPPAFFCCGTLGMVFGSIFRPKYGFPLVSGRKRTNLNFLTQLRKCGNCFKFGCHEEKNYGKETSITQFVAKWSQKPYPVFPTTSSPP